MMHDLLFALVGKPGAFIKQFQNSPFYIDETLNLFSKPEIQQLNLIITLGYHYQQVEQFIRNRQEDLSSYIKALCFGIKQGLDGYRKEILQIEQDYLKEKVFLVSKLHIQLSPYYAILLNLHTSINVINQHNLKGGQIIDYLYERTLTGNERLQKIYQSILEYCYEVLYQQLSSWLQYGYILDTYQEFFIQRIDEKQIEQNNNQEYNWDSSFTLNMQMMPMHYISIEIADKILFIGKAVIVLKSQQQFYITKYRLEELKNYDQFIFNTIIDEMQKQIGEQLVNLIHQKSELYHHLHQLRQFVLMGNGDFYQQFLEDSSKILSLPHSQNALQQLNFNLQKMEQYSNEKYDLFIYNNGFDYKNFSSLVNLQIKNYVIQTVNILRMGPSRGEDDWSGIFRDVKQSIENGFTCTIVFKFKQPLQKTQTNYQILQIQNEPQSTSLALLFQQDQDNSIIVRALLDSNKTSYIQIESRQKGKHEILYKWKLDKIDFSEGDLHSLKLNYQNDELSLILDDTSGEKQVNGEILQPNRWVKVPLKFQKFFQLELGRCIIGIKCQGQIVDVCSWKMIGSNFMNDALWSGLTLKYQVDYPLSLLITPSLQEKFQLFFRYLFPIRHAQYELKQIWVMLIKQLRKKNCRQIIGLYQMLMHIVDALYSYFQTDIIQVQWNRMLNRMEKEKNFEQLRRTLNEFEQSVSNQLFLNLQQIVKNIFQIFKFAHRFIDLIMRIDMSNINKTNKECIKLKLEFDTQFTSLFNLITLLTKNTNQIALFQLLTRLDYNNYFGSKFNNEII